jgi:hypothetical protein
VSTQAASALVPPRERMQALLDDPARVSDEQRAVVLAEGDAFALACPGSGKTRVVGLRVAWASVDGSGRRVAATSYTNVAVEEIRRAAAEAGVALGPEHFVGTLHSFLLRYVIYPFGHLEMDCETTPRIVMDTRRGAVDVDEVRVRPAPQAYRSGTSTFVPTAHSQSTSRKRSPWMRKRCCAAALRAQLS